MAEKIYVLIDHANNRPRNSSLEALAMGQKMASETGMEIHGLILGADLGSVTEQLSRYELASIIVVENPSLREYNPDMYVHALAEILASDRPNLFLLAHTYQAIDLAPRLAARLRTALITDCIGYKTGDGSITFVRQMFRSKLNADVTVKSNHPWLVSLQAGAASADTLRPGNAPTVARPIDLSAVASRRQTIETIEATKGKVDLTRAEIIVGVGRGIKKQDNLPILQELADALGAEIGASRPVVDNEWLGRERQIGSSGQTVTPKLYVACGISGAIQHIVGMKNSGCIVAINSDPNAPIFNVANYGIVGDVLEVVPALTKKIKQERAT